MFNLYSMYNKYERRGQMISNNFQKVFYGAVLLLPISMKVDGMKAVKVLLSQTVLEVIWM